MYIEGDVPVVTTNGNNGGFGGFMNGDGIWAIILFAMIFGYGRNGFGGGYGGGSGIGENYVLATDFATIERKLDGVNNGLCDGFYAQNTNMLTGFSNLQNTLCQGFSGVNNAITTSSMNTERGLWNLSSQFADCCCKTQRAIDQVSFNMANNTCAITNAINFGVRDIVDNQNANYRAIHEELVANKLEAKNDRIAEQQAQITALQLKASQEAQNNYLVATLTEKLGTPCPIPAYITPNPNCCYNYGVYPVNNGCGASVL